MTTSKKRILSPPKKESRRMTRISSASTARNCLLILRSFWIIRVRRRLRGSKRINRKRRSFPFFSRKAHEGLNCWNGFSDSEGWHCERARINYCMTCHLNNGSASRLSLSLFLFVGSLCVLHCGHWSSCDTLALGSRICVDTMKEVHDKQRCDEGPSAVKNRSLYSVFVH